MNPVDRVALQDTKAKAQKAQMLVSKARMLAKGAAAASTGPIGAIKGAGLVSAAGGASVVDSNLAAQSVELALQKTLLQQIAQLKLTAKSAESKQQIAAKQTALTDSRRKGLAFRDAARNAMPAILKVIRLIQF